MLKGCELRGAAVMDCHLGPVEAVTISNYINTTKYQSASIWMFLYAGICHCKTIIWSPLSLMSRLKIGCFCSLRMFLESSTQKAL
jgi:hypothetical protein